MEDFHFLAAVKLCFFWFLIGLKIYTKHFVLEIWNWTRDHSASHITTSTKVTHQHIKYTILQFSVDCLMFLTHLIFSFNQSIHLNNEIRIYHDLASRSSTHIFLNVFYKFLYKMLYVYFWNFHNKTTYIISHKIFNDRCYRA